MIGIQLRRRITTITATAAFLMFAPLSTKAFTVTVGGKTYDLAIYTGSYNENPDIFAPPPPDGNGLMSWWDDEDLVEELAFELGDALGSNGDQGPYFAYEEDQNFILSSVLALNPPGSTSFVDIEKDEVVLYAALAKTQPSTAVPTPLPLFAATAGYCWSRRLRRRIKLVASSRHRNERPEIFS